MNNLILSHLVSLSIHKKESKLQTQILNVQTILNAFGHAKTSINQQNSSRFGKYMELQFNERGRMIGCKLLNYLLDKRRVTTATKHDCNFNIFYTILNGSSVEEKSALSLVDISTYNYTKNTNYLISNEDSTELYDSLKASMRHLGLGKRYHARIMQLIASILHLGQLQFVDDTTLQQEAAYVKNVETLELVSEFLGVDSRALENVLTYKTQLIKNDVTTLILNADQASNQRDELVIALYSLLFTWLIEHINSKICNDNIHNFIGILDLSGIDTQKNQLESNSINFDKFCLNYINERLQNYILRYVFETSGSEYSQDGLSYPPIDYINNASCVDLYDQPRHGFIDIINSFSKKSSSNPSNGRTTDQAMLEATVKYQTGNESFKLKKADTGASYFIIQHFTGPQSYQPDGFIECNRDALNADFVSLFRGGSDLPPSSNTFLVNLFEDKSITTESHPKHADAILNAQQVNKPNRLPSMRRSKSTKQRNRTSNQADNNTTEVTSKTKKVIPVVLAQLRSSLDELFSTIDETMPWFVFCIRPNLGSTKNNGSLGFDSPTVLAQVQSFNLNSLANRFKTGSYQNIYLHTEFCDRYAKTISESGVEPDRLPRSKCQAVIDIFGWSTTSDAAIGNSKVTQLNFSNVTFEIYF